MKHLLRSGKWLAIVHFCAFSAASVAAAQGPSSPEWHTRDLPFHVLSITSDEKFLWVCGTDASIAVSSDSGEHWQVKHHTTDGALLLNIGFADLNFGFAAGTGGTILETADGGETWLPVPGLTDTILQISFSDANHGLVRTSKSLMFTSDGGSHWATVTAEPDAREIQDYPYTFSLVALDASHMAAMLKQGTAQYEPQIFLVTQNSGKSWTLLNIPNVTLYSFVRIGDRYWAVGTEVIHKDQPGGGYAVPVALFSTDGRQWTHSAVDLSACKLEMCTLCNTRGCLASNGLIARIFLEHTTYDGFPPSIHLTAKWAATDAAVCFVGATVQCAPLNEMPEPARNTDIQLPTALSPGPLGAAPSREPRCIQCSLDTLVVDKRARGNHKVNLTITIAKNGTVTSVEARGAPSPDIETGIENQIRQWIFEPYLKDGVPVNVRFETAVVITAINPH